MHNDKGCASRWCEKNIKIMIQPPTILPLPPPDVTECARSSELQIQATSDSQKPHKHALKFLYNSNTD